MGSSTGILARQMCEGVCNGDVRHLGKSGKEKPILGEQESWGDTWWRCLVEALSICHLF